LCPIRRPSFVTTVVHLSDEPAESSSSIATAQSSSNSTSAAFA
jgi:hypothetical protein